MPSKFEVAFLVLALALTGCQNLRTRDQIKKQTGTTRPAQPPMPPPAGAPSTPVPPIIVDDQPPMEPVQPPGEEGPHVEIPAPQPTTGVSAVPKVGLILGPGGARAFAHVGVLQELQKEKIPVTAVAGIEWGAPFAALYANKGLANEAEWQMSKLKTDDVIKKSLIGSSGKPGDMRSLSEFLKLAFGNSRAEGGKIPFACPAHNLAKNQIFVMSKGTYGQMLPYCMAYPPLFRPWQGNVAAVREVKAVADALRARGASVIVLVNVLPFPNPSRSVGGDDGTTESVLWNEIAAFYAKPIPGVDHALNVGAGSAIVTSFDSRRETQQKGSESAATLVRQLARRLGL